MSISAGELLLSDTMVHWPDNKVAYLLKRRFCSPTTRWSASSSSERFDDEYPLDIIMLEARKYYANIVLPYSKQVQKA
jgi:flavorubredoxin